MERAAHPRVRLSADERRTQLLDAAERVMTRDGVAAGTTRAIVAEAGVPLSLFHYCFASRDELIGALIRRLGAAERAAVWAGIQPADGGAGDVAAVLRTAADAYLRHLVASPGQEQMLFELNHYALRTPGLERLAAEQMGMYLDSARAVLGRIAELAGVTWAVPVDELARLVVTITDGVTTTWLADRNTDASRATLGRLLELVAAHAIGSSPSD